MSAETTLAEGMVNTKVLRQDPSVGVLFACGQSLCG